MSRPISFEMAKAQYVHRFTMEHVPAWASMPRPETGKYYAPAYRSDREWYDATKFYGESEFATRHHCYSTGQTWPCGQWLDKPFRKR